MSECLLLKAGGGLDTDALTATAGDVLKGMVAGVKGMDDPVAGTLELTGNAVAGQVLAGYTFYNRNAKQKLTGTMANQGAKTASLNAGGSYTIPAGYHNGSGRVTANSLSSQTPGSATAGQIWTGRMAWVNGSKLTGTLATQGGSTTTPGTSNKTIVSPNKIVTGNIVVAGDPNLIASNIRKGKTIFGVPGDADVYDRNNLFLINGNTINSLIGGALDMTPPFRGASSWSKESSGQKITFTGYKYYSGSTDKYYRNEGTCLSSKLPIKKSSYAILRIEFEAYTPMTYLISSFSVGLAQQQTDDTVASVSKSWSNKGTTTGTVDVDISKISGDIEYYLVLTFLSSIASSNYPPTGGYVSIKKVYFTN